MKNILSKFQEILKQIQEKSSKNFENIQEYVEQILGKL